MSARHVDIFCTVIDNYGDIGVSWRLARQLQAEHGAQVRLMVDDLESFARINPRIDPKRPHQEDAGVGVFTWEAALQAPRPADIVVEAFGCHLPPAYEAALASQPTPPVWINLEYLSAEDWVEGLHGLPSPHPRLPLVKYFFFPGFSRGTGGLLIPQGTAAARDALQASRQARDTFWRILGLPPTRAGERRISWLSYEGRGLGNLLRIWHDAPTPTRLIAFEGRGNAELARFMGRSLVAAGDTFTAGNLSVHVLPFVSQEHYDRLLWACDLNFVRGEDSFVRAQLAARPFVWDIYPTEDGAHWDKLEAFLGRYLNGAPPDLGTGVRRLWHAWIGGEDVIPAWGGLAPHQEIWNAHARGWAQAIERNGDLAANLMKFCLERLSKP